MEAIELLLEQYKALRAEIILCLERRITIVSFGLATIGVLAGGGITAYNGHKIGISLLMFLLLLPLASAYILEIWLAETRRIRRASHFNWNVEEKIASLENNRYQNLLEWEIHIHKSSSLWKHFTSHYWWTILFFSLAATASLAIGIFIFIKYYLVKFILPPQFFVLHPKRAALIVACILGGAYCLMQSLHARKIIRLYNTPPPR